MIEIDSEDLINFDDYPAIGEDSNDNDDIFSSQNNGQIIDNGIEDPFDNVFNNETNQNESELFNSLLAQKGFTDPSKILIENEDGTNEEINFNDLSLEEKIEILNYNETPDLDDNEIDVINYLRENNVSLEELIEYQRNLAIQEYLQSQQSNFTVDDLSDEELYRLEIKSKYDHLTDDEIDQELQKELNNPDIFKKKVDKLRDIYKQEELDEQTRLSNESKLEEEQNYQTLVDTMIEVAQDTNELFDLELEDEDKEEILQFLLQKDINGVSEFAKMINDPKQLFNMAWFALKGQEAFNVIHDYYKKEIDTARKNTSSMTSRKTVVKKDNVKKGEDPYGLNEIFK